MQWAVMQTAVGRLAASEVRSRIAEGDLICYRHFEYSSQCTLTGAEPARLTCLLRKPTDACIKPPNCGLPI